MANSMGREDLAAWMSEQAFGKESKKDEVIQKLYEVIARMNHNQFVNLELGMRLLRDNANPSERAENFASVRELLFYLYSQAGFNAAQIGSALEVIAKG